MIGRLATWRNNSSLRPIMLNAGFQHNIFPVREALSFLCQHLYARQMFDTTNPMIIHLSPDLEEELNIRALHVMQMRNMLIRQIRFITPEIRIRVGPIRWPQAVRDFQGLVPRGLSRRGLYFLSQEFRAVMNRAPSNIMNRIIYTFEQACQLLSNYVIYFRNQLFDPRNILVAIIAQDPLYDVFGVNSFHRCQAGGLVRAQLIPIPSRAVNYIASPTPNYRRQGQAVDTKCVHVFKKKKTKWSQMIEYSDKREF